MVKRNALVVALALGLVLLMGVMPASAQAGGPVLDYLQTTVKPLLDSISAGVAGVSGAVGMVSSALAALDGKVDDVAASVADAGRVRSVTTVVSTAPGSVSGVNLDVVAGDLGDWDKVRRYTVTIQWGGLAGAPPGTDAVQASVGATDGSAYAVDLAVARHDPSGSLGTTVAPYAGVNSFVTIARGADGLGPVDVVVNAYVEVEP